MRSIELHQAYRFDCDECGRECFGRLVKYEPTPEELAELKQECAVHDSAQGYESIETGGEWVTTPSKVTCSHCGTEFEVDLGRGDE